MIAPNVIKFRSIDGLTRYESWYRPTRPEDYLYRMGVASLQCAVAENKIPDSIPTYRRTYRLFDCYIDQENGNRVFEYREQP